MRSLRSSRRADSDSARPFDALDAARAVFQQIPDEIRAALHAEHVCSRAACLWCAVTRGTPYPDDVPPIAYDELDDEQREYLRVMIEGIRNSAREQRASEPDAARLDLQRVAQKLLLRAMLAESPVSMADLREQARRAIDRLQIAVGDDIVLLYLVEKQTGD